MAVLGSARVAPDSAAVPAKSLMVTDRSGVPHLRHQEAVRLRCRIIWRSATRS
jgi:hypothetical protein